MASNIAQEAAGQRLHATVESALPEVRKALVLIAVVAPFIATGFAVGQLWERAVPWRDPVVVFVDRTFPVWVILSLVIPFAMGGWTGLLWGGAVRMFFVHHVTWSVNSVCHTFGRRAFATADRSRNQWMVGLLGMGEGW